MKKLLTLFLCCFLAITVTTVEAGNPSNTNVYTNRNYKYVDSYVCDYYIVFNSKY